MLFGKFAHVVPIRMVKYVEARNKLERFGKGSGTRASSLTGRSRLATASDDNDVGDSTEDATQVQVLSRRAFGDLCRPFSCRPFSCRCVTDMSMSPADASR